MSISKCIRGWVLGTAVVVAGAAPALAADDLATDIVDLAMAVDQRVDSLESGKELIKLRRVARRLDRVTITVASSGALRAIVTAVYRTGTSDDLLLGAARDLVDQILADTQSTRANAVDVLVQLDLRTRTRLERRLVVPTSRLEDAVDLIDSNPPRALRLLSSARRAFARTETVASRSLARLEATFGCGALGNGTRVVARITGLEFNRTFSGFAFADTLFGQISVQGCITPPRANSCSEVVNFTMFYDPMSRTRGPVSAFGLQYTSSSSFGNGQGVQDLVWDGTDIDVRVSQSTGTRIKGCFTATLTASGEQEPQTLQIQGTFVVKRPKEQQFDF